MNSPLGPRQAWSPLLREALGESAEGVKILRWRGSPLARGEVPLLLGRSGKAGELLGASPNLQWEKPLGNRHGASDSCLATSKDQGSSSLLAIVEEQPRSPKFFKRLHVWPKKGEAGKSLWLAPRPSQNIDEFGSRLWKREAPPLMLPTATLKCRGFRELFSAVPLSPCKAGLKTLWCLWPPCLMTKLKQTNHLICVALARLCHWIGDGCRQICSFQVECTFVHVFLLRLRPENSEVNIAFVSRYAEPGMSSMMMNCPSVPKWRTCGCSCNVDPPPKISTFEVPKTRDFHAIFKLQASGISEDDDGTKTTSPLRKCTAIPRLQWTTASNWQSTMCGQVGRAP